MINIFRILPLCIAVVCLSLPVLAAPGISTDRVVVLRNTNSAISRAVADDYAKRRGVSNVLDITCQDAAVKTDAETISFADYLSKIETPLRAFLSLHPAVDFIVMTKGIPLRLNGAQQLPSSLDSYVAALDYAKLPGVVRILVDDPNYRAPDGGPFHGVSWSNRYWNSKKRFTHAEFGGYLVTRLDGYTQAEAIGLTTKSLAAEAAMLAGTIPTGQILLDQDPNYGAGSKANLPYSVLKADPPVRDTSRILRESDYGDYNADMQLAADTLKARKIPNLLETTTLFKGHLSGLMGYVSWGSNDNHYDAAAYLSLGFSPGALSETAVSTGARTFLLTSGGQSLVADIIHEGVTGMKGYSDEPFLQGTASPSILFSRYTAGWTLAESFWAASNEIGWEDIVIGDPLCRAYPSDSSATSSFPKSAPGDFATPITFRQSGRHLLFSVPSPTGATRISLDIADLHGVKMGRLSVSKGGASMPGLDFDLDGSAGNRIGPGLYAFALSMQAGKTLRTMQGRLLISP